MRIFLSRLHRWLGFPLGLLFFIIFATGLLTAIDELLQRTQPPGVVYKTTTVEEQALALQRITEQHSAIRQIAMPTVASPYYQVSAADGRYRYAIDNIDHKMPIVREYSDFFNTVLQLHRNYL